MQHLREQRPAKVAAAARGGSGGCREILGEAQACDELRGVGEERRCRGDDAGPGEVPQPQARVLHHAAGRLPPVSWCREPSCIGCWGCKRSIGDEEVPQKMRCRRTPLPLEFAVGRTSRLAPPGVRGEFASRQVQVLLATTILIHTAVQRESEVPACFPLLGSCCL